MAKRAKSSREMRRQQIRADRKTLSEIRLTPVEQLRAQFFRNGITDDDIQKAFEDGIKQGQKQAEDFVFHTVYAAFLITMIDGRGMEQDEAIDILREIDNQVVLCVEDQELIEQAFEKTGVELNWKDALERVRG